MENGIALSLDMFFFVLLGSCIVGIWRVLDKAGLPGWGIVVPIYGEYLLLKLVGRKWWWLLPIMNFVFLLVPFEIAERFDRDATFGAGLLIFPYIFYPILGFGRSRYKPLSA